MIRAENLTKGFGDNLLLDDVSFRLNARERIGLVGRNGHGKTTLLRMITGEEQPDAGGITIPKNYRLGCVTQQLAFTRSTVLEEAARGLAAHERDQIWKVEKILTGLGFAPEALERAPQEFSGGYQVRLNLAKVLVGEPDLLLLDEPTNYLDITSIRWIVRFLNAWPRELLLISHDRGFMDQVITHTMGIHRRRIRKLPGDTGKYYAQLAQDEEIYEKTRLNEEKRRREIEQFISRFRAKARLANLVQSRIKTLAKMERHDKLEEIEHLEFGFRHKKFAGKQVLRIEDLSFGYQPDRELIGDLTMTIGHGERVGIVGQNGRGKTTLVKLLAGTLTPDAGTIAYSPNVNMGFYEQTNVQSLVDERTVEEEIMLAHPDVDRQQARNICGAMMFSGDDALKKVRVLSGGEKSRVMLGKLLVTPLNLVLLDEPTNHLDLESCDALLAAIDHFPGTVVVVTHNEMFLHALATRLIVFGPDGVEVFEGGYARFLERGGWGEEDGISNQRDAAPADPAPQAAKRDKKELRRQRSALIAERAKRLAPLDKRIEKLEKRIEQQEGQLVGLNDEMQQASQARDGARIGDVAQRIHRLEVDISWLYNELEPLMDKRDSIVADYEKRLAKV